MKNKSFLPIVKAKCQVLIHNYLTEEKEYEEIFLSIHPKGREQVQLNFSSKYCGRIVLEINSVAYYDLFGLFSARQKVNEGATFYVLPNNHHSNITAVDSMLESYSDVDKTINKVGIGNEYLNLKNYIPGDNIKQIHWKLSSKLNEIIIKESSETVSDSFLILIESTYTEKTKKIDPPLIDAMFEVYVSVSKALIKQGKVVSIGWVDKKGNKLQVEEINSVEHLQNMMTLLLQIGFGENSSTILQRLTTLNNKVYSHIIYITSAEQHKSHKGINRYENVFIVKGVNNEKIDSSVQNGTVFTPNTIKRDIQELSI